MYIASDQGKKKRKGIEKLGTGRKEGCEEDGSVPWCFCLSQAIVGEDGFAGDNGGGVARRTRSLFVRKLQNLVRWRALECADPREVPYIKY